MENNMTKELEELEEGSKAEIYLYLVKTTLKNISNWKTPVPDGIHVFWLKKFTSFHDRVALRRSTRTRMDDQRTDHIDPKGPK